MAKRKQSKNDEAIEMTNESYKELLEELENRKTEIRDQIAKEISAARELGDLSENHAYTVAMEKKELNENRISDLEDIIKDVKIVAKNDSKVVTIGKKVTIVNKSTKSEKTVILVGDEKTEAANPAENKISKDSPVGSAILNSREGDTVEVTLPTGKVEYQVKKVA